MTDKLDLAGFHFSLLRCFPSVVVLTRPGPWKKRNYQAYLFICHEKVLTRPGPSKKRNYQAYLAHLFFAYIGCVWLFEPTWRSPGLHCSSIQEKTHPESSAKLCIETCWLKDWNKESMKTCNTFSIPFVIFLHKIYLLFPLTWKTWNFVSSGTRSSVTVGAYQGNIRYDYSPSSFSYTLPSYLLVSLYQLLVVGSHDLECHHLVWDFLKKKC